MPDQIVTFRELAGLGIPYSAAVLRQMWLFGGFPVPVDWQSKWDRAEVIAWVRQHIEKTAARDALPVGDDFHVSRAWLRPREGTNRPPR
jgi:hypothetical protein